MLRKVSLITTMLAALALPVGATLLAAGAATLAPTEAVAKKKGKKAKSHGRKHYSGKRYSGKHYSRKRYSGKRYSYKYRGRRAYGHRRGYGYRRYSPRYGRWWRGGYYGYGAGPCWVLGRYGYVWICF
jgi:hypothetical protein